MVLLDPQGRRGEMHAGILPAPFHMTGSFLTFSPLALKDKLAIARAFYSILQSGGHPSDVDELRSLLIDALDPERRARWSANAPAGVSDLTWSKLGARIERVLLEVA